jgi:hypothetical protein
MLYQLDWMVRPSDPQYPPDPELAGTATCDDTDVPWTMGVRYDGSVPEPITCRLNPRRGRKMCDAFLTDIPMFSTRLLAAIRATGVDNIDTYDARILGLDGEVFDSYKAFNIIGAIKCANLAASEYESYPPMPFLEFSRLVVDPGRSRDMDLFRLGEDPVVILISQRVQAAIAALQPVGIVMRPIELAPGK